MARDGHKEAAVDADTLVEHLQLQLHACVLSLTLDVAACTHAAVLRLLLQV